MPNSRPSLLHACHRFALGLIAAAFLVLACVPILLSMDGFSTAFPIALDRAMLQTVNQFGLPNLVALPGGTSVYFTTGNNTALFRWDWGGMVRLLQTNDPHPGYPGSVLDGVGLGLQGNSAGHLAVLNTAAYPDARDPAGLFVYDGRSYTPVVLVGDEAPGTGGTRFRGLSSQLINSSDQVAFIGSLEPIAFGPAGIFVGSPGGSLSKVALQNEIAPDTGGGKYGNLTLIGLNDSGTVAFFADINSGNTSRAVFLYHSNGGGVTKIVKNGDDLPGIPGKKFSLPGAGSYLLNSSGDVAFMANSSPGGAAGIWIGNAAGVQKLALEGDATPLGGSYAGSTFSLRGFNNAGRVLFIVQIAGGSSAVALLLDDLAQPAQVVFYEGQAVPGGTTEKFSRNVQHALLNNAGKVAFRAGLNNGSYGFGAFLYSADALQKVLFQGEATPLGGTFGLAGRSGPTAFDDNGRWIIPADVLGPNKVALFLYTPADGVKPIVSTDDPLPPAANYVLRSANVTSDDEALVIARRAGGKARVYARPLRQGLSIMPRLIFSDFDPVEDGGRVANASGFSMNDKEEIVFIGPIIGGGWYPASAIFGSRPGEDLGIVTQTGKSAPGMAGGQFNNFSAVQLNNQTQVAFVANVMNSAGNSSPSGVFLASESAGSQVIARAGDPSPAGFPFASFGTTIDINGSGRVAFYATHAPSSGMPGIFVGSTTAAPARVLLLGEASPAGGTVSGVPNSFSINNANQVAFWAGLTGGAASSGVFLGKGGAVPVVVALVGAIAGGTGGSRFQGFNQNSVELNNAGQVAFHAFLGGPIYNGYFVGSATSAPVPRLVSGQHLPGGGMVQSVSPGAGYIALADSGDLAMYVPNIDGADNLPRFVIAGPDRSLRAFAAAGDEADGTFSRFGRLFPRLTVNSSGVFTFSCILVEGPAKAGIFRDYTLLR